MRRLRGGRSCHVGSHLSDALVTSQMREGPHVTPEENESREGRCWTEGTELVGGRAWDGTWVSRFLVQVHSQEPGVPIAAIQGPVASLELANRSWWMGWVPVSEGHLSQLEAVAQSNDGASAELSPGSGHPIK